MQKKNSEKKLSKDSKIVENIFRNILQTFDLLFIQPFVYSFAVKKIFRWLQKYAISKKDLILTIQSLKNM